MKTAVVCNEKVVVQVMDKVSYHEKAITFHDKSTNHGMVKKLCVWFQSIHGQRTNRGSSKGNLKTW